jgi:hypothetical protein
MPLFKRRAPTFSTAPSKRQFLEDWVAGVFEEAGLDRTNPATEDLTNMAANGIVRPCLKEVADAYGDHQVLSYLQQLDPDGLSWRVDEMYNTSIELATTGRPGPVLRERTNAFNKKLDETFAEIRPNYVDTVQANSAHLSDALRAMNQAIR